MERDGLIAVVKEAWKAFECAALSSRVYPAMPILFFGDVEAYSISPFRVVTVGLNPSLQEFPGGSPFQRFPGCAGITAADGEQYLQGLCSYFRYPALNDWRPIREFRHKESGERRRRPYPVDAKWYEIMGAPVLFVSGVPSQTPFGSLSDNQKRRVGELARRTYCQGR